MEGFVYAETGEPVNTRTLRIKEFVTGKAKTPKRLGVVELEDGTVRVFHVRHDHNPDALTGAFKLVYGALYGITFESAVNAWRNSEKLWITAELDERPTY
ncbi:hypothetical protein [Rhodococcus qingshengii]|uniref:hypothetical protein n=1 Tax=Rhodococcus qingshengii TaxID=334542 RepID=UPI0035D95C43